MKEYKFYRIHPEKLLDTIHAGNLEEATAAFRKLRRESRLGFYWETKETAGRVWTPE